MQESQGGYPYPFGQNTWVLHILFVYSFILFELLNIFLHALIVL